MEERATLPVEKAALYFGYYEYPGHYLYSADGRRQNGCPDGLPRFWYDDGFMDGQLLRNGRRPDAYDGKVFWTGGGRTDFWFAFVWWDRSGDKRSNSSSGFYVRGFDYTEPEAAFAYACETFPHIIERQRQRLELQIRATGAD